MGMTCFWDNLHQVGLKWKDWKTNNSKVFGRNTTKGPKWDSKIEYDHPCPYSTTIIPFRIIACVHLVILFFMYLHVTDQRGSLINSVQYSAYSIKFLIKMMKTTILQRNFGSYSKTIFQYGIY